MSRTVRCRKSKYIVFHDWKAIAEIKRRYRVDSFETVGQYHYWVYRCNRVYDDKFYRSADQSMRRDGRIRKYFYDDSFLIKREFHRKVRQYYRKNLLKGDAVELLEWKKSIPGYCNW